MSIGTVYVGRFHTLLQDKIPRLVSYRHNSKTLQITFEYPRVVGLEVLWLEHWNPEYWQRQSSPIQPRKILDFWKHQVHAFERIGTSPAPKLHFLSQWPISSIRIEVSHPVHKSTHHLDTLISVIIFGLNTPWPQRFFSSCSFHWVLSTNLLKFEVIVCLSLSSMISSHPLLVLISTIGQVMQQQPFPPCRKRRIEWTSFKL